MPPYKVQTFRQKILEGEHQVLYSNFQNLDKNFWLSEFNVT